MVNAELLTAEVTLGATPKDPEQLQIRVIEKAPTEEAKTEEGEAFSKAEPEVRPVTVFARDDDGCPFLYNYVVKGFFKETAKGMMRAIPTEGMPSCSETTKLIAYRQIITDLVFIHPRRLRFIPPEGMDILNETRALDLLTRPLRGSTPQGEIIAIATSEMIKRGAKLRFQVLHYNLAGQKPPKPKKGETEEEKAIRESGAKLRKSGASLEKCIREWLDYGILKGLGQWRNSGMGIFTWKECTKEEVYDVAGASPENNIFRKFHGIQPV